MREPYAAVKKKNPGSTWGEVKAPAPCRELRGEKFQGMSCEGAEPTEPRPVKPGPQALE